MKKSLFFIYTIDVKHPKQRNNSNNSVALISVFQPIVAQMIHHYVLESAVCFELNSTLWYHLFSFQNHLKLSLRI